MADGTRAAVLCPRPRSAAGSPRGARAQLAEARALAEAISLDVVASETVPVRRIRSGSYFGPGTVGRIAASVEASRVGIAVVDATLMPVQQRFLETAWKTKVIDRTQLILEIFGARARTREGALQVELARLAYQNSRLVRSWTHLERQRGGSGFLGGPGEAQIESDRRTLSERMARLRSELEEVRKTRALHRRARRRTPHATVALVGYTNAGKSELFNRLTSSRVTARDQLFATLDPVMRSAPLPSGLPVILSDTVGFVSNLPTRLVAAFRATLEEVVEADAIVHVRDVSHADAEHQKRDVEAVLREMGIDRAKRDNVVEVLNKIDLLDAAGRERIANLAARKERTVAVSALTGENCGRLLETLDGLLGNGRETVRLSIRHGNGAAVSWLYRHGEVLGRSEDGEHTRLEVVLSPAALARFRSRHPLEGMPPPPGGTAPPQRQQTKPFAVPVPASER